MKVLIITKIFPNREKPGWAPFNRQQFSALARLPGVEVVDVLATIPWFPGVSLLGGRSLAAGLTRVPRRDTIAGLSVRHPRTLYLPRIGHGAAAPLYAASLLPGILRYRGRVDVLLAAWAYPDGCAAIALARLLGVPVVVKLHGSDINVLSGLAGPARFLRTLLPRAARVVAVSAALAQKAAELGVPRERIDVVRNGVDGALFHVRDQAAARAGLGANGKQTGGKIVVCVGRLEREKGVFDLLEAFALLRRDLPSARLFLCGGGGAADKVRERTEQADLAGAVHLTGAVPLSEVPRYLAAADVVVMPSWAEGLPNTVLEALACGRRVVSTDVGGVSEVLTRGELGLLVPPQDPRQLAQALAKVLSAPPLTPEQAHEIAASSSRTWEESAGALLTCLARAAKSPA